MAGRRNPRADEMVREAVARIIADEINDPRLTFLTVTDAQVTEDSKHATIWFTMLEPETVTRDPRRTGGDRIPSSSEVAEGLEAAKPRIQKLLGMRIRMRATPVLVFKIDPVKEQVSSVDRMLREARERGDL